MGNNIWNVLITTLKAKITPIVNKIKTWTSWNFIRTQLISRLRDFFSSLFDVKPKNKKDYYSIGNWLVSKKLAFAIVVVVGIISLIYFFSVNKSLSTARTEGIKTYSYDSVLLRFASEKVRITGKSGYLAYEGDVADGSVTGYGTLYRPDGSMVYQGNFLQNRYEGSGSLYYPTGVLNYKGYFQANEFQGIGSLYRENGTLLYEGDFVAGLEDGAGKLYDTGSNLIYTGNFSQGEIQYNSFLGKLLSEVADMYTGRRVLYENEENFVVVMEDIDAMYLGSDSGNALDDEMAVEKVYVLQDYFPVGTKRCETIPQIKNHLGISVYEGYSDIILPEAVAAKYLEEKNAFFPIKADMETTAEFEDYYTVDSFEETGTVYLYSFYKDGLIYTFVCEEKGDEFLFYSIEKEGEATE